MAIRPRYAILLHGFLLGTLPSSSLAQAGDSLDPQVVASASAEATASRGRATEAPAGGPDAGELIPLPKPEGGFVGTGAISPRATRFAYEVLLPDSNGQIWILDLNSREARPLTRGPGRHVGPAWSPDGSRIAFWDAGPLGFTDEWERDGIWVVALENGRERRVFGPADEGYVRAPQWIGRDSILFDYIREDLTEGSEFWIVGADGQGARVVRDPSRYQGRSPTGRRRAYLARCCDVWGSALWVSPIEAGEKRCVAGPIEYGGKTVWSPDEGRIFFSATVEREPARVWVSEIDHGGAQSIETPPGRLGGMSMSVSGVLAVQIQASPDSTLLWLVGEPDRLPRGRTAIPACPSLFPALAAFARGAGLTGELRIRETFRIPEYDFLAVDINYDFSPFGHSYRTAVEVGDHIGWIGGTCRVDEFGDRSCPVKDQEFDTFRPRPDESFLWSAHFLQLLAEWGWDRRWVDLLLLDPSLPETALESLLAQRRFDEQLVEDPRMQDRPDWLLRIWERNAEASRIGEKAFDALWRLGFRMVRDPGAPRRLLLQFARRVARASAADTLAAPIAWALLEHPTEGRDPEVLAHLAQLPLSTDPTVLRTAGQRLIDDPSVPVTLLHEAVANLAADSQLAERLFKDPRVLDSPSALVLLARTPWDGWSVAERAREILRERGERLGREGDPRRPANPFFLPDAWRSQDALSPYDGPPVFALLEHLDPVFEHHPPRFGPARPRPVTERLVCEFARSDDTSEADLVRIAESAVYATSSVVASCLLENPRAREDPHVLRILAGMVDVNHDQRFPGQGAPTIEVVRQRAATLLGDLDQP